MQALNSSATLTEPKSSESENIELNITRQPNIALTDPPHIFAYVVRGIIFKLKSDFVCFKIKLATARFTRQK